VHNRKDERAHVDKDGTEISRPVNEFVEKEGTYATEPPVSMGTDVRPTRYDDGRITRITEQATASSRSGSGLGRVPLSRESRVSETCAKTLTRMRNRSSRDKNGLDPAGHVLRSERNGDLLALGRIFRTSPGITNEFLCISIDDLAMHMVVLGQTGFGKTTFTVDLIRQLWQADPTINWTIIDLKGEYLNRLLPYVCEPITVFKAGLRQGAARGTDSETGLGGRVVLAPLLIDLFELGQDDPIDGGVGSEECVERVFSILKESLAGLFKENTELSPMMERTLREALRSTYENKGRLSQFGRGFFDAVLSEIEMHAQVHGKERADLAMSCEALKNRIDRFRRGMLGRVLNSPGTDPTREFEPACRQDIDDNGSPSLIDGKVVIDLSECMKVGCNNQCVESWLRVEAMPLLQAALLFRIVC